MTRRTKAKAKRLGNSRSRSVPLVSIRPAEEPRPDRPVAALPVDHLSASSMALFSTNPILFKIKNINGDKIDSTTGVSAVIGKAFHHAMEFYYPPEAEGQERPESANMQAALEAGTKFMQEYPEGWIEWSEAVKTRQDAVDRVAFAITEYIKASKYLSERTIACEDKIIAGVDVEWRGQRLRLPVPLKGFLDRVTRRKDGKLGIRDYKTCSRFSDLEKISGRKMIQAVEYYFLGYAKYGEAPHSMTFEEVKTTKNKDGSPQVREYEVVYADNPLYFEFYFRLYEDIVRALNGEMVYVPNIDAMFDGDVSIIAYIQRLDVTEEVAERKKKLGVTTLTELLKRDIEQAGNMRKLLKTVEDQLTQAKSLDYANMTNDAKIATKLLEHGMILKFDSLVQGATVDLYRFSTTLGVKMSRLRQYADDIQQVLGATSVRVLAPIPGSTLVGVEVPRDERRWPALPSRDGCNLAIGETVDGQVRRFDLREAPHMLVAGASGSGKSVFAHAIIQQLKDAGAELVLVDPKQVEFSRYDGALTEREEIEGAINSLVETMDSRYKQLKAEKKRDAREAGWRPTVLVIDEYADLIMASSGSKKTKTKTEEKTKLGKVTTWDEEGGALDIAGQIQRLAQKGRAAGIHIVLITQRASTKIITGDVKVNFPVKAVFRMAKAVDSQVMLDEDGAEKLLGKGDMLFSTDAGIERLQGFNAV